VVTHENMVVCSRNVPPYHTPTHEISIIVYYIYIYIYIGYRPDNWSITNI